MTRLIQTLAQIAGGYDVIVFDQWGVLHNGAAPYPTAVACIAHLRAQGARMAVLSNSGKRAAPNADRIAAMGFDSAAFESVVSSGEALWQDIAAGHVTAQRFYAIERGVGDAARWAEGLNITLCSDPADADAVLLMGLPDGDEVSDWMDNLRHCHALGLPLFCTNPDKASPRGDGYVTSPGVLASAYQGLGSTVHLYGKPHLPIFRSLEAQLGAKRPLMVGDSLEHDIAGAHAAGWDSVLIQGGLYAPDFASGDGDAALARLIGAKAAPAPTYRMDLLA